MSKPSGKKGAVYQAPAVDKAVDILEYLSLQRDGATMKEIADGVGRSTTEIYRVALALERRSLIFKDPQTDRFSLSMRLFELSHQHPPSARLIGMAQPIMEDLAQSTLQSCHLSVADGERLLILASVDSPLSMHYRVKLGSSFPLTETSSGTVLVTFWRPEDQETIMGNLDPQARKAFEARVNAVKETDREVRASDVVDGIVNISTPIRDYTGRVRAALTIPFLKRKNMAHSEDDVIAQAVHAASQISAALGFVRRPPDNAPM
ncbi:IclR family transcriptional regulator [Celeribacter sp.]|uniref:IclR family transcriptional regulator n=1 Tax=Celeribacter sp. TaxID=1890673 RepID=UPI003A8E6A62